MREESERPFFAMRRFKVNLPSVGDIDIEMTERILDGPPSRYNLVISDARIGWDESLWLRGDGPTFWHLAKMLMFVVENVVPSTDMPAWFLGPHWRSTSPASQRHHQVMVERGRA